MLCLPPVVSANFGAGLSLQAIQKRWSPSFKCEIGLIMFSKGIPFDVDDEILSPYTPDAMSAESEEPASYEQFMDRNYQPPSPILERQRSIQVSVSSLNPSIAANVFHTSGFLSEKVLSESVTIISLHSPCTECIRISRSLNAGGPLVYEIALYLQTKRCCACFTSARLGKATRICYSRLYHTQDLRTWKRSCSGSVLSTEVG
jgi:hypothetical protein